MAGASSFSYTSSKFTDPPWPSGLVPNGITTKHSGCRPSFGGSLASDSRGTAQVYGHGCLHQPFLEEPRASAAARGRPRGEGARCLARRLRDTPRRPAERGAPDLDSRVRDARSALVAGRLGVALGELGVADGASPGRLRPPLHARRDAAPAVPPEQRLPGPAPDRRSRRRQARQGDWGAACRREPARARDAGRVTRAEGGDRGARGGPARGYRQPRAARPGRGGGGAEPARRAHQGVRQFKDG